MDNLEQALIQSLGDLSVEAAKISFLRNDVTKNETDPVKIAKALIHNFSKAYLATFKNIG